MARGCHSVGGVAGLAAKPHILHNTPSHNKKSARQAAASDWVSDDEEATEQVWRELLSVERALLQVGDKVNSRSVLLCTDATAVVKDVNWGNGPSRVLSTIMRRIFDYCVPREIMLSAEHVPGTEMKEALMQKFVEKAHLISRLTIITDPQVACTLFIVRWRVV